MKCNLVNEKHRLLLIDLLEKSSRLPLPREDMYLGNINFALYHKSASSTNQYIFQIQWGSKSIFIIKNLPLKDMDKIENEMKKIFEKNAEALRSDLIKYCISQLNNIILVELPIHIRKEMPAFIDYKLFVDVTRCVNKDNKEKKLKWPSIALFISWDDEFGDFQEFVYPLNFAYGTNHFILDYKSMIQELKRYRDKI